MAKKLRYHSYLLRIWPTPNRSRPVWRASLESTSDGARLGFATLEDLFAYLRQQAGGAGAGDASTCDPASRMEQ